MDSSTILIIGGTSGLGEGFARRFYALGKRVIITGRRQSRLDTLAKEMKGLETYQWDVVNLADLGKHASKVLKQYPDIDTIVMMAGKMESFSFFNPAESNDSMITSEINTNLTAPIILSRTFVPFLASLASEGKTANLIFVTSGLAYIPLGFYPVYCPTKTGIHYFALTLRQQLNYAPEVVKKNLSICELSPPYVDTALDAGFRDKVNATLGDRAPPPMPLEEYLDLAMKGLSEKGPEGKMLKEVTVPGFSELGVTAWRGSLGKILEGMGVDC
ncbi:NAD(P)-binding protein [Lindgomyces ingoldianus]|uniref:NAD(P)-binding protein n=1 Tax=Lindgomyces ingoldianus TaxID=673940 RepID=A0ACB6QFM4_9PLEO|nr:NAD(P)-binding protein [Lindgomyces ingoldianus]KAF2465295.1 NAD(P)-binding protein [Lindgomyces ingoldianus]